MADQRYDEEHERTNYNYLVRNGIMYDINVRNGSMYDINKLAEVNYILGCQNRTTRLLLADPVMDKDIRLQLETLSTFQMNIRLLIQSKLDANLKEFNGDA